MAHSELYLLFTHYWWLVFVLVWAVARLARLWSRHVQAQQTLDMIKSYVDQGKEPPPEMLKILQPGSDWRDDRRYGRGRSSWMRVFLFAALSCGFAFMAWQTTIDGGPHVHQVGLIFVAIVMAGLALGSLVCVLDRNRAADLDRTLPK